MFLRTLFIFSHSTRQFFGTRENGDEEAWPNFDEVIAT